MKENIPHHRLVQTFGAEWNFEISPVMQQATVDFDDIWFGYQYDKSLSRRLRRFLAKHPYHIDGLTHLALYHLGRRQFFDSYILSMAAVAVGKRAIPEDFDAEKHFIPFGYLSNRPYLRALHCLMCSYANLEQNNEAIKIGYEMLKIDPEDRLGARWELPLYLIEEGRLESALTLFTKPAYKDTFFCVRYLEALIYLRLNRTTEADECIRSCLYYNPQVARFLLNPGLPQPARDSFGMISGGEFEGWFHARQFHLLWLLTPGSLDHLKKISEPLAAKGWPIYTPSM